MGSGKYVIAAILTLSVWYFEVVADVPCAPRAYPGKSTVCVCNSSYCDEVTRDEPASGQYVIYTSSEAGSRFLKKTGKLVSRVISNVGTSHSFALDPSTTHQTVEGFGGAVTDAASINWSNLTDSLKSKLISSYFGPKGVEYNMLRVPIGGCDFSTHAYAYNELPVDDIHLSNFSLAREDFDYKIPMIKQIMNASTSDIHIVSSVWSPSPWMKTNDKFTGYSRLKPEYYQTFADYHIKFIRAYAENQIPIWGITTTNEPIDASIPFVKFQTLGWSPSGMSKWITENLGPSIRGASDLKNIKILALDDQRYTIPLFLNLMINDNPKVMDWLDGVAVHFYTDSFVPAAALKLITDKYPDKFIINTEACEGSFPWQKDKVDLGSWNRAKSYINDIITDLNYNLIGWMDWNLCLNEQGGPNWSKNYVDSPIIVFPQKEEFVKQPMFYAMGHFSKWIPRGSIRIDVRETKGLLTRSVAHVAFLTPKNTIVLVLHNDGDAKKILVTCKDKRAVIDLEKNSVSTVEFNYKSG